LGLKPGLGLSFSRIRLAKPKPDPEPAVGPEPVLHLQNRLKWTAAAAASRCDVKVNADQFLRSVIWIVATLECAGRAEFTGSPSESDMMRSKE